jgi:hypothetical protein
MSKDDVRLVGRMNRRSMLLGGSAIAASSALIPAAQAQPLPSAGVSGGKPNILILWGDDS